MPSKSHKHQYSKISVAITFTNQNLGEIFKLIFKRAPQLSMQQVVGQVDRATLGTILLSGLQDRVAFRQGGDARRVAVAA
jgi:hypothetical protein